MRQAWQPVVKGRGTEGEMHHSEIRVERERKAGRGKDNKGKGERWRTRTSHRGVRIVWL